MVHDPAAIGAVVRAAGRRLIVDAVSAFGALPFDVVGAAGDRRGGVHLQQVPGGRRPAWRSRWRASTAVSACAGNAGSWSFDLSDIYAHALRTGWGSFRFTPPAQVLNAFNTALDLYDAEGGQPARLARYTANMRVLYDGVSRAGADAVSGAAAPGADHRQRARPGRSGLGPASASSTR